MVNKAIRRLRRQQRMTQVALASRAKIAQSYVVALEAGTRTPSLAVLRRLARAFRVPVADLLKGI